MDGGEPSLRQAGWRGWIATSAASLRLQRWLAGADGIAALVAAVVVAVNVFGGGPVSDLGLLLVPGIPLVVGGQLWTIGILTARNPTVTGGWRARMAPGRGGLNPRTLFFAALPKQAAYGFIGAFFLAWLAAITAFPDLSLGGPTHGTPGCPWALDNHGAITCVSHATYERAGAAVERFASGVLMGFFTVHLGVVTSELVRRRASGRRREPSHSANA